MHNIHHLIQCVLVPQYFAECAIANEVEDSHDSESSNSGGGENEGHESEISNAGGGENASRLDSSKEHSEEDACSQDSGYQQPKKRRKYYLQ